MELAQAVYELTTEFPRDERYGLTAQLQRAAVSIPSNIAEGNARGSTRDYARFISIAYGSLAELQTQMSLASRLGFVPEARISTVTALAERVGMMLLRLRQSLERRVDASFRVPGPGSRGPESGNAQSRTLPTHSEDT
jgi:four helix bundle protein